MNWHHLVELMIKLKNDQAKTLHLRVRTRAESEDGRVGEQRKGEAAGRIESKKNGVVTTISAQTTLMKFVRMSQWTESCRGDCDKLMALKAPESWVSYSLTLPHLRCPAYAYHRGVSP